MSITNIPNVKCGIISVSRDCFIISLSENRRKAIVESYSKKYGDLYEVKKTIENECDMLEAVKEAKDAGCNALVVFLGNFGPETPETLVAKEFDGPVMYVAAAEETGKNLINGRGDAYCGVLNCSYNLGLRHLKAFIPEYPVGTADEIADMIAEFQPVARTLLGLQGLKIITFGPRPQDFFACNAPIAPLYDIGVEIEENSELDLFESYKEHKDDPRIKDIVEDMAKELGTEGNPYPDLLPRMAQYELTLLDWMEAHKGARKYVAFACEVDIYGALSEYMGICVSGDTVTLLDINNSVPKDMFEEHIKGIKNYTVEDTFMGFHCGNTPLCKLKKGGVKYQLIQNRLLENGGTPDITRGTLEGDIDAGDITFYRLQSTADGKLRAYIAEGEVLPVATGSFGGIGVFAIPEMGRFYRHVLIEKRYPHHGAVAFGHYGKVIFDVLRQLGVEDIAFNQPKGMLYASENPFVD